MKTEAAVFEASAALCSQLVDSTLPEIAFSGRSNVGKSTLINTLLRRKNLARTSATPGKTATINFYRLDTLRLVDLPGYGYAKVSDAEKRRWKTLIEGYLEADRDLRLVLQLVDMRHPPTQDDRMMMEYMVEREIPFVVVLTKADKLNKTQFAQRMASIRSELPCGEELTIIPCSSENGLGIEELRAAIEQVCGEE